MMMKFKNLKKASNLLYSSRKDLVRIDKLDFNCRPKNKNEAYKIQDNLIKKYLLVKNNRVIGKKIGCTNKQAQKQINVNEPFYGNLLSKYSKKSNCKLKFSNFFKPLIEPEFSFILNKELKIEDAPFSFNTIKKSIKCILPSIEIVDSRFNDWTKIGINNLIADNGVNAFWIYGKKNCNIDEFNLDNHSVKLFINGKIFKKGNSKNVLNNPINSIKWLLDTLAKQKKILPKNNFISTGTCTPAIPIKKGDDIYVDFGKIGNVNVKFI